MKFANALLLLATGVAAVDVSPVTRVVQLLKGMQEKIEVESKQEEDLYDTFVCWGKSVISSKTASNEKAKARIDDLETYVSDLESGRIELTSERVDLEKEIAGLEEDIEVAEAQRAKEKEDYEAAKAELDATIAALKEAIKVLEEATKDASLVSVHSKLNAFGQNQEVQAAQGRALERAIALGEEFLSHGDAIFLKRLINHDVPKRDEKKLKRKADFKAKYKARSGGIVKTLKNLLFKFSGDLDEAEFKEKKAEEQHKALMGAKKQQLSKSRDALEKMELEGAARGLSLSEAKEEIKNLKGQVENDEKYIKQTEADLEAKEKEWKERQDVRSKEQEAISKAIAILYNDDARDLFKESFKSQGYTMLLQEAQKNAMSRRQEQARAVILRAARAGKDGRLVALASTLAKAGDGFEKVIEAIDKMLKLLKKEQEEDLKIKEDCEKARADDTRAAIVASRAADELTDTITRLESEIKELEKEIDEKTKEIDEIEKELKEATKIREEETAEFKKSKKDDEAAAVLVADARDVLAKFYKDNALLQQQPQFTSEAGKAPPPPPSTWSDPYKGKQPESEGIVAILEMIEEDIKKDITKAEQDEKEAQEKYDTLKEESEKAIKDLKKAIEDLEGDVATKKDDVADATSQRASKKEEVDSLLKKIEKAAPGCDFFAINFVTRNADRTMEMDGLVKARAILKGAKFPEKSELLQKEAKKHI